MKTLFISLYLACAATATWAACSTSTMQYNGKYVTCTTCCDSRGNCNTSCY